MLQYYRTIIAYSHQLLDMEDLFEISSKLFYMHINFYFKNLAQVEVRYGLLNVA